jgi:hypothetical protein
MEQPLVNIRECVKSLRRMQKLSKSRPFFGAPAALHDNGAIVSQNRPKWSTAKVRAFQNKAHIALRGTRLSCDLEKRRGSIFEVPNFINVLMFIVH